MFGIAERDLSRVRVKIGHAIDDASVRRRLPRVHCRDCAGRRHDARWIHEHRTIVLAWQRESLRATEVQIDGARLIEVVRVRRIDREIRAEERRGRPAEVRAPAFGWRVAMVEQRDRARRVGERRRATDTGRRNGRRISRVGGPVWRGRRAADAQQLLHASGQSCRRRRVREQRGLRHASELTDTTAQHLWATHRDRHRVDHDARAHSDGRSRARRRAIVFPYKAQARAEIDAIRRMVGARAEEPVDVGVELRRSCECVGVDAQASRQPDDVAVVTSAPRRGADPLAAGPVRRIERSRKARRDVPRQVAERREAELAESVGGHRLAESVEA